jgi:pectate lyase
MSSGTNRSLAAAALLGAVGWSAACAPGDAVTGGGTGGGPVGSGGTAVAGTGGAVGSGGATVPGTGGAVGSGGATVPGTGGAGTGGAVGSGGSAGRGTGGAVAGSGGSAGRGSGGTAGRGTGGAGTGGAVGSGGSTGSCAEPPAAGPLLGWASVNGMGQNGTTGGTGTPVTVTTTAAFNSNASGTTSRVIYVMGNLSGVFNIGSNKTIVGICGARLQGGVNLSGSVNVIMRNLTVVGNNCTDSPQDCSGGDDAIGLTSGAHHIWIDHLDVSDGSDGNLDITQGSDFVTVSWTKFRYSSMRTDPAAGASGHRFSNLIGSADMVPEDMGHLNITWHHNWWAENVNQRMPRSRRGQIHVVNNLYTSVGNSYCTNAGYEARLLVENNIYIGVRGPLQEDANGDMLARNNVFMNIVSGTQNPTGMGFVPPYALTPDATTNLAATIMAEAGPH